MMHAISEATFPNGHKSSRVFRWKGASGDLINVLAKTVANGGAFTVRPATLDEVAASEVRRLRTEKPNGIQCPTVFVDEGDYTATIGAVYGEHQGLNADWSSRAWPVGGGVWILDDENKEQTVSVVRTRADGEIDVLFSGPVREALVFVRTMEIKAPEVAS